MMATAMLAIALACPSLAHGQETQSALYTVQPGDTLSAIAERLYGSPDEWPRLFEANGAA